MQEKKRGRSHPGTGKPGQGCRHYKSRSERKQRGLRRIHRTGVRRPTQPGTLPDAGNLSRRRKDWFPERPGKERFLELSKRQDLWKSRAGASTDAGTEKKVQEKKKNSAAVTLVLILLVLFSPLLCAEAEGILEWCSPLSCFRLFLPLPWGRQPWPCF